MLTSECAQALMPSSKRAAAKHCFLAFSCTRCFNFSRCCLFFSPGPQRWQKEQDKPLVQPFVNRKAHGLQEPLAWPAEPLLGSSAVPGAGPIGGGGGGGTTFTGLAARCHTVHIGTLPKMGGDEAGKPVAPINHCLAGAFAYPNCIDGGQALTLSGGFGGV